MSVTIRTFLKLILGLFAFCANLMASLGASQPAPKTGTTPQNMASFIAQLRREPALRQRFGENPSATMRENGIDPAPFNLPARLDGAQIDAFIADWTRRTGAEETPRPVPRPGPLPPSPPAPVYGPPPGLPPPR